MSLDSYTTAEWEHKLADQLRSLRLRLNLQQSVVAEQADISLTALKNLESGHGATIKTLIKVLRVYHREDWLVSIAPQTTISPLQMLAKKEVRQRASGRKKTDV